jgi:hypothetical protein
MTKLYFVKGVIGGQVVCAGHWLASDHYTAQAEFAADAARTNAHPDVVAAGLSRDLSGATWEAKPSKSNHQNAMNYGKGVKIPPTMA